MCCKKHVWQNIMFRHILLIRRYTIRFLSQGKMLSWKSTFLLNRRISCGPCAIKKLLSLLTNLKRALRIPIIVYRRNVRLMDIQDKSTGLSKMPLNIVHDKNIEQDDISHEYYEIKLGVHRLYSYIPKFVF